MSHKILSELSSKSTTLASYVFIIKTELPSIPSKTIDETRHLIWHMHILSGCGQIKSVNDRKSEQEN